MVLHRADHAQVDGGWLALGDDLIAGFVEFDFEQIDPVVVLDDLVDQEQIAIGKAPLPLRSAIRPSRPFAEPRADALKLGVELLGSVLVHGRSCG